MADLVVRKLVSHEEVVRVPVLYLDENYVEKVMSGMLINMDTDNYFIDDSEIDAARKAETK